MLIRLPRRFSSFTEKSLMNKEIYKSGKYVEEFKPDDEKNPFYKIYDKKRDDVITIADAHDIRILDLGGGMGRISGHLSIENDAVLLDISEDMLNLAKMNYPSLKIVQADADNPLPFPSDCFDLVICLDLLCHVKTPRSVIKEIKRVIKNSGRLIIDSANSNPLWIFSYPRYVGYNPFRWISTLLGHGVLPEWQDQVTHFSKKKFYAMVEEEFEIIKKIDYGPVYCSKWNLVCAKVKNENSLN